MGAQLERNTETLSATRENNEKLRKCRLVYRATPLTKSYLCPQATYHPRERERRHSASNCTRKISTE